MSALLFVVAQAILILMFFGRMRFAVDAVSTATQLVDDVSEAMTDTADKFSGRVTGSVKQNGKKLFRLGDAVIKG